MKVLDLYCFILFASISLCGYSVLVDQVYARTRERWEGGDFFLAFILFILLAAGVYWYWFFHTYSTSVPAHTPPRADFVAQSFVVLNATAPCAGVGSLKVTKTIFIAEYLLSPRPDVIDVHYTCGSDTQERAFLWEPTGR